MYVRTYLHVYIGTSLCKALIIKEVFHICDCLVCTHVYAYIAIKYACMYMTFKILINHSISIVIGSGILGINHCKLY